MKMVDYVNSEERLDFVKINPIYAKLWKWLIGLLYLGAICA